MSSIAYKLNLKESIPAFFVFSQLSGWLMYFLGIGFKHIGIQAPFQNGLALFFVAIGGMLGFTIYSKFDENHGADLRAKRQANSILKNLLANQQQFKSVNLRKKG